MPLDCRLSGPREMERQKQSWQALDGTVPTISNSCSSLDVLGARWVAPHFLVMLLMRLREGKKHAQEHKARKRLTLEFTPSLEHKTLSHYCLIQLLCKVFLFFANKVVTVLV